MAKAKQNKPTSKLKVFSLGGLEEVGKNITVLEYENDIIVIDCGMGFPDDEMPGVDFVIPDITYLEKNAEKVRGIFITHGHEDHIGALPYVLRDIHVPVYATRLTLGILRNKLSEHSYDVEPELIECKPGDIILDSFGGSGTTIVAAEQLGRKARLMEFDPHYADVIIARYEKLTGKKAERIN